jgi:hypothetical protein
MESKLIYAKLKLIKAAAPNIAKKRRNQQQGYQFRGIDDFYETFQPLFASHGVTVESEILNSHREEKPTKSGGMMVYTIVTMRFSFVAEDGSKSSNDTIGEALDSGDKSSNKAMSAALKYALTQRFLVTTDEDSDTETASPELAKKTVPQVPNQTTPRSSAPINPPPTKNAPPAPKLGVPPKKAIPKWSAPADGAPIAPAFDEFKPAFDTSFNFGANEDSAL